MEALIAILSFLVVIIVLILAHEIGHFVTARATGVKIEEFGIKTFGDPNPQSWMRTPEQVAGQQAALQKEASLRSGMMQGGPQGG